MIKKFCGVLLTIIFIAINTNLPVVCAEIIQDDINVDDFDRASLYKNRYTPIIIQDDFINMQDNGGSINREHNCVIDDEIVKATLFGRRFEKKKYKKELLNDEQIVLENDKNNYKKNIYNGKVNIELGSEVLLKPVKKVSTKNTRMKIKDGNKYEKYNVVLPEIGEDVAFKVLVDVKKDEKVIIPKNSIVYAKVDEVSPRAMGGAPADLTLDEFVVSTKDGKKINLSGTIDSSGYTLSPWIGVAELATTPFLFGLAVPLLRLLPGGQAVISPRKTYTVYYTENN